MPEPTRSQSLRALAGVVDLPRQTEDAAADVQIARDFTPMSDAQLTELVTRAEPCSKAALFFRFYEHE